ncbi:MAG: MASE1 domain-containing protein [Actinomycetota bacterium]
MSDRRDGAALPAAGPVSLASSIAGRIQASWSAAAVELGKIALVGGVYYVAAILSLRVALVGGQVTPIWPPTGVAVAGILLFGRKVWPAIALGAFLVNAPVRPC